MTTLAEAEQKIVEITAERDALRARLDAIEAQRAQWRDSKRRGRRVQAAPGRYNPKQTSIYGETHQEELISSLKNNLTENTQPSH